MAERRFKVAVQQHQGPSFDLADESFELERQALDPIGAEIVPVAADSVAEYLAAAHDADAVIARGRRIDAEIIAGLERCLVIGCGSVGTDQVDVGAATRAGILVTNVPDVFIEEVADHALMLLLAAARRLTMMDRWVRQGRWQEGRAYFSDVPRLWGRTLGLLAFGNVARALARRAAPLGMRILACDPYVSELEMTALGVEPVGLDDLLERSDYLSIHAPLSRETRHLLGEAELARLPPGAVLINTGRGPVVDEEALIAALQAGRIAVAALDVLEIEPPARENRLLGMENVILTPHIASATSRMMPETRRRLGREIAAVLAGRWPLSCVNPTVRPRSELTR